MTPEQRLLRTLATDSGEKYGFDLATDGPTRRWLYVILHRLEERGWIASRFADEDPPRRRLYRITDVGRAAIVPMLPVAKVR